MEISKATKERFIEKVKEVESGCHEWQSTMHRDGYGKFWLDGKTTAAHRVSYMIANGSIPYKKLVLLKCDNRKCVNPQHLYAGTHSQNVRDKIERFKGMWGSMKITFEQVLEIRKLHQSGVTQTKIAKIFDIHQTQISRIVREVCRKQN